MNGRPFSDLRTIRDEERRAGWLLLFVVLAAASATGLLEHDEAGEPSQAAGDVR